MQAEKRAEKRRHQVFMTKLDDASATQSLPLTTIAKTNEPLCGGRRPKSKGAKD
jgi:hypothetical protein